VVVDKPKEEEGYTSRFSNGIKSAFGYGSTSGSDQGEKKADVELDNGMGTVEINYFPKEEDGKEAEKPI